jgi:hypothetical protein
MTIPLLPGVAASGSRIHNGFVVSSVALETPGETERASCTRSPFDCIQCITGGKHEQLLTVFDNLRALGKVRDHRLPIMREGHP